MALPNNNITISMVRNELGESSNDLSVLCKSDKINKWSKWKPIASSDVTLTDNLLAQSNWGLTIPVFNNVPEVFSHSISNPNSYAYQKPIMCRLGDFRNYEHTAFIPMGSGKKSSDRTTINKGGSSYESNFNFLKVLGNNYKIGFDDIESISGLTLYPCVIFKINSSYYWTSSASPKIIWSSNSFLKTYAGQAQILLCLVDVNYNNVIRNTPIGTENFVPFPSDSNNINPYSVTLTNSEEPTTQEYYIFTDLMLNDYENNRVRYDITFACDMPDYTGGSLKNVYLSIYNQNPAQYPQTPSIGNILLTADAQVSKNNPVSFSGTSLYTGTGESNNKYFGIWVNGFLKASGTFFIAGGW